MNSKVMINRRITIPILVIKAKIGDQRLLRRRGRGLKALSIIAA